ncbi:MAG: hypothetical protein ACREGL_10020 [Alphaproteobacteria bacterium]
MMLRGLLEPLVSWRTYDFFARDLTVPVAPFVAAIPLEMRVAVDADFLRFRPSFLREGVTGEEIERRRRAGDRCFLGVAGDRLVHFTWLFRRPAWLAELGATLRLGPDEAYIAFSYTDPDRRGQGVQPAVTNFMIRWEQAVGIRRHYYFVMRHNVPARKITTGHHAGAAAEPIRTVRTVRFAWVRSFLAYGFEPGGRPRLEPAPALDLGPMGLWVRAHMEGR